jgi:hypothetical protein
LTLTVKFEVVAGFWNGGSRWQMYRQNWLTLRLSGQYEIKGK